MSETREVDWLPFLEEIKPALDLLVTKYGATISFELAAALPGEGFAYTAAWAARRGWNVRTAGPLPTETCGIPPPHMLLFWRAFAIRPLVAG